MPPNFPLQDGSKKIILNASAFKETDNQALQGFLQYVKTGKVTTEYTRRIEKVIQTVKISEQARKEYRVLPAVIMDAFDEGIEQGKSLALQKVNRSVLLKAPAKQSLKQRKRCSLWAIPLAIFAKLPDFPPQKSKRYKAAAMEP